MKDLDTTVQFYESLGFRIGKREDHAATCHVNWFWIRFIAAEEAGPAPEQPALYMKVDDIDDAYGSVVAQGHLPSTEPRKQRTGGPREFRLDDPDGNSLAFFAK